MFSICWATDRCSFQPRSPMAWTRVGDTQKLPSRGQKHGWHGSVCTTETLDFFRSVCQSARCNIYIYIIICHHMYFRYTYIIYIYICINISFLYIYIYIYSISMFWHGDLVESILFPQVIVRTRAICCTQCRRPGLERPRKTHNSRALGVSETVVYDGMIWFIDIFIIYIYIYI